LHFERFYSFSLEQYNIYILELEVTEAIIYYRMIDKLILKREKNIAIIVTTTFVTTFLMLCISAGGPQNAAFAQQSFTAKLSGGNEVPPVTTSGSGVAVFHLSPDGKTIDYQLNLTKMSSVMGAHIHSGKQGENGPVVAGLFNPSMSGPPTGTVNGPLKKGTLTSSDLSGSLAGKQISDLVNMIKSGGAYVNIHTTKNQNGEIRGQIT